MGCLADGVSMGYQTVEKPPFWLDQWCCPIEAATMPRKLRLEYPGARYHLMGRGDQGDDIFLDDADRPEPGNRKDLSRV